MDLVRAIVAWAMLTLCGVETVEFDQLKLMPRVYRNIEDSKIEESDAVRD